MLGDGVGESETHRDSLGEGVAVLPSLREGVGVDVQLGVPLLDGVRDGVRVAVGVGVGVREGEGTQGGINGAPLVRSTGMEGWKAVNPSEPTETVTLDEAVAPSVSRTSATMVWIPGRMRSSTATLPGELGSAGTKFREVGNAPTGSMLTTGGITAEAKEEDHVHVSAPPSGSDAPVVLRSTLKPGLGRGKQPDMGSVTFGGGSVAVRGDSTGALWRRTRTVASLLPPKLSLAMTATVMLKAAPEGGRLSPETVASGPPATVADTLTLVAHEGADLTYHANITSERPVADTVDRASSETSSTVTATRGAWVMPARMGSPTTKPTEDEAPYRSVTSKERTQVPSVMPTRAEMFEAGDERVGAADPGMRGLLRAESSDQA